MRQYKSKDINTGSDIKFMECRNCSKEINDTAEFCNYCGHPQKDAPKIVLSDEKIVKKRRKARRRAAKTVMFTLLIILIITGIALGIAYYSKSLVFVQSPIDTVDNQLYRSCFSLIEDVRDDEFKTVIDDLMASSDTDEFMVSYTKKFDQFLIDKKAAGGYTDDEKLFVQTSHAVWYVNYQASVYERTISSGGMLEIAFKKDAEKFREYADQSYQLLKDAKTRREVEKVKQYLADKEIPVYD